MAPSNIAALAAAVAMTPRTAAAAAANQPSSSASSSSPSSSLTQSVRAGTGIGQPAEDESLFVAGATSEEDAVLAQLQAMLFSRPQPPTAGQVRATKVCNPLGGSVTDAGSRKHHTNCKLVDNHSCSPQNHACRV
jgi:hypothetical protein